MMYYTVVMLLIMSNYISAMEHAAIVRHRSKSQEKLSSSNSSEKLNSVEVQEDEDSACPLCFEPYDELYKKPISLTCDTKRSVIQHTFCTQCLKDWMTKSTTCPNCRSTIPEGTLQDKDEPIKKVNKQRNPVGCLRSLSLFLFNICNSGEHH